MNLIMTIVDYFLWFILYSVIGWIMETVLFAVRDKKVVKRGFLFGPLCPIYGTGAVICTLSLYGRITNVFALFGVGLVLCTVLEYITHFVLEKVFHSMWWDYSNQRFNIKGRICLCSSLLFGFGVAILLKFVQPFVERVTLSIPQTARLIIFFVIYTILIIDVAITVQSLKNIIKTLKEIQQFIIENMQENIDKTDEKVDNLVEHIKALSPEEQFERIIHKVKNNQHIDGLVEHLKAEKSQFSKIKRLFPKVEFSRYKDAMAIIFNRNSEEKDKQETKATEDEEIKNEQNEEKEEIKK